MTWLAKLIRLCLVTYYMTHILGLALINNLFLCFWDVCYFLLLIPQAYQYISSLVYWLVGLVLYDVTSLGSTSSLVYMSNLLPYA